MDIIDDIKIKFRNGSVLYKLIFINVSVFVLVGVINLVAFLANTKFNTEQWLAVPADVHTLLFRPWTLITYMFLHYDLFHILFNMLWLFWFGELFMQFVESRRMLSVYILGGLSGAFLYIVGFNLIPAFSHLVYFSVALGASASVYAIVIAVCAYVPDYSIGLLFIGRVKLKYLALVIIVIDLLSISGTNAGGHIAHLGGAIFGYVFAIQLKKGNDITKKFAYFMDYIFGIFKKRPKMRVTSSKYRDEYVDFTEVNETTRQQTDHEYNRQKYVNQEIIDKILDKISQSGYDSLTKEEKETLFKASNKKS